MRAPALPLLLLALGGCSAPEDADSAAPEIYIPGHNECLAVGEEMSEETCLAVVADFGHYPTTSHDKSGLDAPPNDMRAQDPTYLWLTSEVKRCACSCCHTARWGGAGVAFYDLDYKPVWIDSASLWSLSVFGGWTGEYAQTLPSTDMDRVRAYIEAEAARRRAAEEE